MKSAIVGCVSLQLMNPLQGGSDITFDPNIVTLNINHVGILVVDSSHKAKVMQHV